MSAGKHWRSLPPSTGGNCKRAPLPIGWAWVRSPGGSSHAELRGRRRDAAGAGRRYPRGRARERALSPKLPVVLPVVPEHGPKSEGLLKGALIMVHGIFTESTGGVGPRQSGRGITHEVGQHQQKLVHLDSGGGIAGKRRGELRHDTGRHHRDKSFRALAQRGEGRERAEGGGIGFE